jgi:hypothetical protein
MFPLVMISLAAFHISFTPPAAGACNGGGTSAKAAVVASAHSPLKVNPETAKIRARIDSAIVMLEAGSYREFLQEFVDPEFVEHKGVDAIMEEFEKEKADELLEVLKEIRTAKPTYSKHGTIAAFKVPEHHHVAGPLRFVRVDRVWYIQN